MLRTFKYQDRADKRGELFVGEIMTTPEAVVCVEVAGNSDDGNRVRFPTRLCLDGCW